MGLVQRRRSQARGHTTPPRLGSTCERSSVQPDPTAALVCGLMLLFKCWAFLPKVTQRKRTDEIAACPPHCFQEEALEHSMPLGPGPLSPTRRTGVGQEPVPGFSVSGTAARRREEGQSGPGSWARRGGRLGCVLGGLPREGPSSQRGRTLRTAPRRFSWWVLNGVGCRSHSETNYLVTNGPAP